MIGSDIGSGSVTDLSLAAVAIAMDGISNG
jgi:hypothetical protein